MEMANWVLGSSKEATFHHGLVFSDPEQMTPKIRIPHSRKRSPKPSNSVENVENKDPIISPGLRSVAAMAGRDEESLLLASLVVEDTPERESKNNKCINPQLKTPPVSSKRKRRVHKESVNSIPIVVLDLSDEETVQKDCDKSAKKETKPQVAEEEQGKEAASIDESSSGPAAVPCMARLKEELSCAVCLEICFEPSTTSCGHSFCKKCLVSATERCGKRCPKCRQLISNDGRNCNVNTVLWNTIQLLFPQEIETRKATYSTKTQELEHPIPKKIINDVRNQRTRASSMVSTNNVNSRRSRGVTNQAEDAALGLGLQREDFMEAFRGTSERPRMVSMLAARENLRAMASRVMNPRVRRRPI